MRKKTAPADEAVIDLDSSPYAGGKRRRCKVYSFDPCAGIPQDFRHHILGGQCCNWSEYTWNEYDLEWKMWPRTCAMAEVLWTAPSPRDCWDFFKRMEIHRRRLIAQGVNCAPLRQTHKASSRRQYPAFRRQDTINTT